MCEKGVDVVVVVVATAAVNAPFPLCFILFQVLVALILVYFFFLSLSLLEVDLLGSITTMRFESSSFVFLFCSACLLLVIFLLFLPFFSLLFCPLSVSRVFILRL